MHENSVNRILCCTMSKSVNRKKKRKKRSSTDDESLVQDKIHVVGGHSGGLTTSTPVSDILNETNSVLYDKSPVFSVSGDSVFTIDTNMASGPSSTSTPTNVELYDLLKNISSKLEKVESKLETLSVLEKKVDNFEREFGKLWAKMHDTHKLFADRVSAVESKMENLEFMEVNQQSEIERLTRLNIEVRGELPYLKS